MPCGTPFDHCLYRWSSCLFCLLEESTYGGARDAMRLGDLTQTLAPSALLENSNAIDIEWPPADIPTIYRRYV